MSCRRFRPCSCLWFWLLALICWQGRVPAAIASPVEPLRLLSGQQEYVLGPHLSAFEDPDGALIIDITDDGPGIPPAIIDKIFDPFFTSKTVGRGAGLGLSMARDVMRLHGGTLVASSDVGRGATLTLTFPGASASGAC